MAAYIYYGAVLLDVAEHLEAAKLPFAAFRCVDGGDLQVAVDGRGFVVDELDCPLRPSVSRRSGFRYTVVFFRARTAML